MRKTLTKARVFAIATPIALLGAGTAAAATGSLPGPAQNAASSALAHFGVSVPKSSSHNTNTPNHGAANVNAVGPDASLHSPAAFGLCTAFTHGGLDNATSPAYRNLAKAAGGAQSIAGYCATIIAAHNAANTNSSSNTTGVSSSVGSDSGAGPSDKGKAGSSGTGGPSTTPPRGESPGAPSSHP